MNAESGSETTFNRRLALLLADEPPEVSAEMIRINTEARHLALQETPGLESTRIKFI